MDVHERGLKATDLDGVSRVIGATIGPRGRSAARDRARLHLETTQGGKPSRQPRSDQTARLARIGPIFALDTWDGDLESVRQPLPGLIPELGCERPMRLRCARIQGRAASRISSPRLRYGLPVRASASRAAPRHPASPPALRRTRRFRGALYGGRWNSPGGTISSSPPSHTAARFSRRAFTRIPTVRRPGEIAALMGFRRESAYRDRRARPARMGSRGPDHKSPRR